MRKTISYSKPLARQWEIYLKNYTLHQENIEAFYQRMLQKSNIPSLKWQKRQLNIFIWNLWYSDATQELLHLYFVDSSLKEFLENLPLADLEGISKYINENGFIKEYEGVNLKYFPFGIHIPNENKYKAFAFGLTNNESNQMVLSWAVEKGGAWCSELNYKQLIKEDTEDAKDITRIFRLAINTIAYMEAFPECIKEGVPKHISERSKKSYTLEISEKVIESKRHSESGKMSSPHFRKGYYKRLTSDFYKNKKGQIIFVSETMVNGKAKTIYTTENIEGLNKL